MERFHHRILFPLQNQLVPGPIMRLKGIALLVLLTLFGVSCDKIVPDGQVSNMTSRIIQDMFGIALTNSWTDVKATGRVSYFYSRKNTELLLLRQGDVAGLLELSNKLSAANEGVLRLKMVFVRETSGSYAHGDHYTREIAPWYKPEEHGSGFAATRHVYDRPIIGYLFGAWTGSNAVLYTRVLLIE